MTGDPQSGGTDQESRGGDGPAETADSTGGTGGGAGAGADSSSGGGGDGGGSDTDPNAGGGPPDEAALVADLRRVAARDDTDDPPTTADVRAHGAHAPREYRGAFGSFAAALEAAGLGRRRRPTPDALREDLRRVAARDDTSDPPTRREYDDRGTHGARAQVREFGSWTGALEAAGLPAPSHRGTRVGAGEVAADLRRVAAREDTADPPTMADYRDHGTHHHGTVGEWFESWPAALDAAGLDGDAARERAGGDLEVGEAGLLADLRRVAAREDTSDPPTTREYDAHGDHSRATPRRRFGSWPAALDAAGLDGDAARERAPDAPVADPDALLDDLRRVAAREDTSDPPTTGEYAAHGEWAATTVVIHFDSWNAAVAAADLPPRSPTTTGDVGGGGEGAGDGAGDDAGDDSSP